MSTETCRRCSTEYPYEDIYCPVCDSCQHCGCCPCYQKDCKECRDDSVPLPIIKPGKVKGMTDEDWDDLYPPN